MKKITTFYRGAKRVVRCSCTNPERKSTEQDFIGETKDYPAKGCKTSYIDSGPYDRLCPKCGMFFWFAWRTNDPNKGE